MQNVPDLIWAYDYRINDFRLFQTAQEWEGHIEVSGAVRYLKEHLQKSLINDFFPACEAYKRKVDAGFFALPRIVFPYIAFLGTLLGGGESSKYAIEYMNKYMAKINSTYEDKQLCDFIYRVYRHGLAHTNMPKVVSENGKTFGWRIVFDDRQHLNIDNNPEIRGKSALLIISPNKLAEEVISSIDEYIEDLKTRTDLFDNFKKGFIFMATTSHRGLKIPSYLKI